MCPFFSLFSEPSDSTSASGRPRARLYVMDASPSVLSEDKILSSEGVIKRGKFCVKFSRTLRNLNAILRVREKTNNGTMNFRRLFVSTGLVHQNQHASAGKYLPSTQLVLFIVFKILSIFAHFLLSWIVIYSNPLTDDRFWQRSASKIGNYWVTTVVSGWKLRGFKTLFITTVIFMVELSFITEFGVPFHLSTKNIYSKWGHMGVRK